ncbi:MAG TPA: hypothetical protein VN043_14390 [Rhodanobacter sp.]|nr:hypothetical protein [Rhodanobacter sp.]
MFVSILTNPMPPDKPGGFLAGMMPGSDLTRLAIPGNDGQLDHTFQPGVKNAVSC